MEPTIREAIIVAGLILIVVVICLSIYLIVRFKPSWLEKLWDRKCSKCTDVELANATPGNNEPVQPRALADQMRVEIDKGAAEASNARTAKERVAVLKGEIERPI
jgi:hypothetical protein